MITMTYEYKLEPSTEQVELIEKTLEVCRSVWNYALTERKDWSLFRKSPINACSVRQEYIIPANTPYPNYNHLCEKSRYAPFGWLRPRLQALALTLAKKEYTQLADDPIRNDAVKLPQLGWIKWRFSGPIPEGMEVKQARVVKRATLRAASPTGYFVMLSLQLNISIPDTPANGHPMGIDLGLEKYLATTLRADQRSTDGQLIDRPKFFKALQRKLKLLQRRLKNKKKARNVVLGSPQEERGRSRPKGFLKKGSSNWCKLNQKIARVHQRISDTRKDWQFKLAHSLCDQAGMIFVEDIDFSVWAKGILRKHILDAAYPTLRGSRSTGDYVHGQFLSILSWVCWKRGVYFAKVDKNYTSQICPNCGTHTGKKLLSQREHKCSECGYMTHRDIARAQVIRERGISALGHNASQIVSGEVLDGGQ